MFSMKRVTAIIKPLKLELAVHDKLVAEVGFPKAKVLIVMKHGSAPSGASVDVFLPETNHFIAIGFAYSIS